MTRAQQVARERQPIKKAALLLGPGFITGAADDDPSGIGTYSVAAHLSASPPFGRHS